MFCVRAFARRSLQLSLQSLRSSRSSRSLRRKSLHHTEVGIPTSLYTEVGIPTSLYTEVGIPTSLFARKNPITGPAPEVRQRGCPRGCH